MDKDCAGGTAYNPETVIFIPDQVNQLLKCYEKPMHGVRKATNTWYVRSTTVDGEQFTKGKFTSPEAAADFYQGYIRLKMVALIKMWNIPAATAERLIAL